jgi:hypothetical protein
MTDAADCRPLAPALRADDHTREFRGRRTGLRLLEVLSLDLLLSPRALA